MKTLKSTPLLIINLHSHPLHFQLVTSDSDKTWPQCQGYHDAAKVPATFGDKPLMGAILNYVLERLRAEFNEKITKLENTHIAEVDQAIKEAPTRGVKRTYLAAKSKIKLIFEDTIVWKGEWTHDKAHLILNDSTIPEEICDFVTKDYWLKIGDTSNRVKRIMFDAGMHVDHFFNYLDIVPNVDIIREDIAESIIRVSIKDGNNNSELWINAGKKKNAEWVQKVADATKNRLTAWQTDITTRSDNNLARGNKVIQFLLIKMQKAFTDELKDNDEFLRISKDDTVRICPSMKIDTRADVIQCVTHNTKFYGASHFKEFPEIVKLISFINLELRSIGL